MTTYQQYQDLLGIETTPQPDHAIISFDLNLPGCQAYGSIHTKLNLPYWVEFYAWDISGGDFINRLAEIIGPFSILEQGGSGNGHLWMKIEPLPKPQSATPRSNATI